MTRFRPCPPVGPALTRMERLFSQGPYGSEVQDSHGHVQRVDLDGRPVMAKA